MTTKKTKNKKTKQKNRKTKQIRIYLILLLLLFLVGFFIRFVPVRTGFHYWDECVYLQHAEIISGFRAENLFNEFDIRPPLLPLLIAGIYQFSHSLIAAHLIVTLISSLGIILIFLLAKELFNRKIALISTLIYTLIPLSIWLSHDILVDSILPTFWLLAFLFTIKTIKTEKFYFSVLAGIAVGLAILLKFSSLILPLFIFLTFFVYNFESKYDIGKKFGKRFYTAFIKTLKSKRFWIIILFLFLTLSPYLIWNFFQFGNSLFPFIKGYLVLNWDTPSSWTILYKNFYQMLPYPLLIGLASLIFFNIKQRKIKKEEILLWVTFLGIFLSMHTMQHKEIRFLLPVSPFITILSAVGFFGLFSFISNKKRYLKLIIGILIGAIVLSSLYLYIPSHYFTNLKEGHYISHEENDLMRTAFWLKDNTQNDSIIYVNTQYPVSAYFSERKIIVLPFWTKFQDRLSAIMSTPGYFILFPETAETRDPTHNFIVEDNRFILVKQIGTDKNIIKIYEYKP